MNSLDKFIKSFNLNYASTYVCNYCISEVLNRYFNLHDTKYVFITGRMICGYHINDDLFRYTLLEIDNTRIFEAYDFEVVSDLLYFYLNVPKIKLEKALKHSYYTNRFSQVKFNRMLKTLSKQDYEEINTRKKIISGVLSLLDKKTKNGPYEFNLMPIFSHDKCIINLGNENNNYNDRLPKNITSVLTLAGYKKIMSYSSKNIDVWQTDFTKAENILTLLEMKGAKFD